MTFQTGRDEQVPDQPARKRRDFLFEPLRWRVIHGVEAIPAAQLDRTQLGMVEGVPIQIAPATKMFITPSQQLEIVFDRVIAEPIHISIVRNASLTLRTPEFNRP